MRVLVLGPIAAVDAAGRDLPLGGLQPRALLAALAADANRTLGIERLIDALWPEDAPENAVGAVQTYVSRLRTQLGGPAIVTAGRGYSLSTSAVSLDSARFEQLLARARTEDPVAALETLDDALALWRGPAFGPWHDAWWARPVAERLEGLRLAAASERVDALLSLGRFDSAIAETELLVATDPLRESFVRQRVAALHLSGRSADALRAAAGFRKRLGAAAGLEASPELARLERMVLEHDDKIASSMPQRSMRGYEIGHLLAEGAHGAVYSARQPALERDVAIKVVRKERADNPDFVRRFEAEARLVARLEHPNIVPLYDYWREPGGAFLVFRLLRGGSLQDLLIRGEPLTFADVDHVVDRVGNALVAAHRAGVVHHDVRAANILFDEASHPYLSDFGIAVEQAAAGGSAHEDVIAFAQMVTQMLARVEQDQHVVDEPVRSLLRRAAVAEIQSMDVMLAEWRLARGAYLSSTPTPDRPRSLRNLTDDVPNPYKGLRPFTEAERSEFFGRAAACEHLLAMVRERTFVAVVGPSGCGKSSLTAAAVVPALRDSGYAVAVMTPGVRPMRSLEVALRGIATEPQSAAAADDPAALLHIVAIARPVLLVVDQLEELWTVASRPDRDELIDALRATIAATGSQLRVVVTIRADFYDRPLDEPRLAPLIRDATFALAPMLPGELEAAIVEPLAAIGVGVERGLVAAIISDVLEQPGALPLLQFTLSALFARREAATLTRDAYRSIGGVAGAVASQAERIFQQLSAEEQELTRLLFEELVTVSDHGCTRRRVAVAELPSTARDMVEPFDHARLLTFDRDAATGQPTIEVAHEALLANWPRLAGWIDTNRSQLTARRAIRDAADTWDRAHREPSHLFRGARLDGAVELVDRHRMAPSEQAFIDASLAERHREDRRDRRRLRRAHTMLTLTAVLLVVSLVAGAVALQQRAGARRSATAARQSAAAATDNALQARTARVDAELRSIALQARSVAPAQPDLGMLLAAEVVGRKPGTETEGALLATLQANPLVRRVIDVGLPAGESIVLVTGRAPGPLVAASRSTVLVIDGATLRPTGVRWAIDGAAALAVATDGRTVASVSRQGAVERHDVGTGAIVGPTFLVDVATAGTGPVAAFVSDGSLVVGAGRTIGFYPPDAATPTRTVPYDHPVATLRSSPDGGSLLASAYVFGSPTGRTDLLDHSGAERVQLSTTGTDVVAFDATGHLYLTGFVPGLGNHLEVRDARTGDLLASRNASGLSGFFTLVPLASGEVIYSMTNLEIGTAGTDLATITPLSASAPVIPWVALDGTTAVGSLGERLVVIDPTRRPRPVETLPLTGSVYPKRIRDRLLVANADGGRVYDAATLQPVGPNIAGVGSGVFGRADLSPDGKLVAAHPTAELRLYDAETGTIRGTAPGEFAGGALSFSPDGTRLAVRTANGVAIRAVPSLELLRTYPVTGIFAIGVAWSPDSAELVSMDASGVATRIELATARTTTLEGNWASFTDDNERIIVSGIGAPLRVLDRSTGATRSTLAGFKELSVVHVIPGDRRVFRNVTAGYFDVIDLDTGTRVGEPFPLESSDRVFPTMVASARNGTAVYLGIGDAAVRRIELEPTRWLAMACEAAGRNLTRAEWTLYFGTIDIPYHATCAQYPAAP